LIGTGREPLPIRGSRGAFHAILLALLISRSSSGALAGTQTAHAAMHAGVANFTLIDQFGRRFTLAEHIGHPLVLFFGYSHCGDVCPLTLAKIERAKTDVGVSARSLQVIFITVDPHRDTPAALRRFINNFDPSFIALTGSNEQLARVYAAYHVTHRVLAATGRSQNYEVEHSSFLYFIGRNGRLRGFGDWADSQTIVTESVREVLAVSAVSSM
jgi:protein SCO1/2